MAINRELSQFASFVEVNDTSRNIGIATTATPFIGVGTTNPTAKFEVVGHTKLETVNISGVSTFNSNVGVVGLITSLDLKVSGIASVGTAITMYGATGIISAYKFFGDGSGLTGTISGIGIRSEGVDIGYGATVIDFKGPGVSTITNISAGIVTVFFEGGGGNSVIDKQSFNVGAAGTNLVTLTNPYTAGNVDVYLNGLKLSSGDFTETSANVIGLTTAAVQGDTIDVVSFRSVGSIGDVGLKVQQDSVGIGTSISTLNFVGGASTFFDRGNNILDVYIAQGRINKQTFNVGASGTTLLTLSQPYESGKIDIYRNGIRLASGDFTETSSTTVGLATSAISGDVIEIQSFIGGVNTSALSVLDSLKVNGVTTTTNLNTTFATVGSGLTFTTGIGTNLNVTGISTVLTEFDVGIGATVFTAQTIGSGLVGVGTSDPRYRLEVGPVGASGTSLWVNGDTRITGILTIGTSSITLDGSTNVVKVGSGITIDGGSGIISATSLYVNGAPFSSGVGISTLGGVVGTGITSITFRGSGISTVTASAGIATINVEGGAVGFNKINYIFN